MDREKAKREFVMTDSPVFTASDYLAHLQSIGQIPDFVAPKSIILYYQKDLLNFALRKYSTKRVKIFGSDLYLLKKQKDGIGVFGGFGVGSPATASIVDLFCALGVEQFFIIGMAGALQPNLQVGDLVLSSRAICGEGVSRFYVPENEIVESNTSLVSGFSQVLTAKNHIHSIGTTWTTDAPFREMKSVVGVYQNRGMLAVDMEAAAMLAVAEANHKSGLAAFSITDSISNGSWVMPKDLSPAKKGLFVLLESLVDFISS